MSEPNVVRIEITVRLEMTALLQLDPAQSKAILDGIAAVLTSTKHAVSTASAHEAVRARGVCEASRA